MIDLSSGVGPWVRSFCLGRRGESRPAVRLSVAQVIDNSDARFTHETGVAAEIGRIAEPVIEELGLRLVRVVVSGRDGATVQIMAERPDGTMSVEDCAALSRRLSPVLDACDPMPGRYRLEISSPGIDRPLVRPSDFETWAGCQAKVELRQAIAGRKRFRGEIEGFEDGEVRLKVALDPETEPQVIGLPAERIAGAKLVLTEELVRAALAKTPRNED